MCFDTDQFSAEEEAVIEAVKARTLAKEAVRVAGQDVLENAKALDGTSNARVSELFEEAFRRTELPEDNPTLETARLALDLANQLVTELKSGRPDALRGLSPHGGDLL